MLFFKKVPDLQNQLAKVRQDGKSIGFTPTMGALHEGHISLVKRSVEETDVSVSCIFVNPSQFNDPADLEKYPRTPGKDIDILVSVGCNMLFMPSVEEIYPPGTTTDVALDFDYLDQPMEGAYRPGHFKGVAQVVKRLLDIICPDKLYMGQKDFQQFAIVKNMLGQLKLPVELICCPIIREEDGLAMSSRNVRLTPAERAIAPAIYQTLTRAKEMMGLHIPQQIEEWAMKNLAKCGLSPEYFQIVDGLTLKPLGSFNNAGMVVACTAVKVGDIRLIDNLIFQEG